MTRWDSSTNDTDAGKVQVVMVTMVDLNFTSGAIYVHDGIGNLLYNSRTYQGIGEYGTIDAVSEDLSGQAKSIQLGLSGVEASLVNSAMTENYQGKVVTVYVGILDPATMNFVDNPQVCWEGRMDYMAIDIAQGSAKITLVCENRMYIEPKVARYTDQDQQLAHAGDSFFDQVAWIPLATANWGSTTVQHPGAAPIPVGGGPGPGKTSPNQR